MTKTKDNDMGNRFSDHTVFMASQSKEEKPLTKRQCELHEVLQEAKGDDPWSIAIRGVFYRGQAGEFRKLIEQLKSQCRDNEEVMINIIGRKAFNILKAL